MEQLSVADFKTNFSEMIDRVKNGEEIEILYGRAKKPVARMVPIDRIGRSDLFDCFSGRIEIVGDFKMTAEELCEL